MVKAYKYVNSITNASMTKEQKLRIPRGFDPGRGQLVLGNYADIQPHVLKPYESRVYLWNENEA